MLKISFYCLVLMLYINISPVQTEIKPGEGVEYRVLFHNPDSNGPCATIEMRAIVAQMPEEINWENFYRRNKMLDVTNVFCPLQKDGEEKTIYAKALDTDQHCLFKMNILPVQLFQLQKDMPEVFENINTILKRPGILELCASRQRELDVAWDEVCASGCTDIEHCLEDDSEENQDEILPFTATKGDLGTAASLVRINRGELSLPCHLNEYERDESVLSPHDDSDTPSCKRLCEPGALNCG